MAVMSCQMRRESSVTIDLDLVGLGSVEISLKCGACIRIHAWTEQGNQASSNLERHHEKSNRHRKTTKSDILHIIPSPCLTLWTLPSKTPMSPSQA
ncbi:hypothetical protein VTJ04DRAFT_1642 [Mycothermus thermophilus]|uniref:uncharacterized protein n=1 Tax=Humicola insolens TaxID=85995 RepID=UPI0037428AD6